MADLFILEGADDSGKGTLLNSIRDDFPHSFKSTPVQYFREPGSTDVGVEVRQMLDLYKDRLGIGAEFSAFWLGRFTVWEEMGDWFKQNPGGVIFLDRSFPSTFAYQVFARQSGIYCEEAFFQLRDWVLNDATEKNPNLHIHHIYLDLPAEIAAERRKDKEAELKDLSQFTKDESFQSRVIEGYLKYYRGEVTYLRPYPNPERHTVDFIDATRTRGEMFADTRATLRKYVSV